MARRKSPSKSPRSTRHSHGVGGFKNPRSIGAQFAKRRSKRYIETAKKLAPYVPKLKKLTKKKLLTNAEKAQIRHYEKVLQHAPRLQILKTKKERQKFKHQKYAPNVEAVGLRGITASAKVKTLGDDIILSQNGETWILWKLERAEVSDKRKLSAAAKRAWALQFPMERLMRLAELAYQQFNVKAVRLWASSGLVGREFANLNGFLQFVEEKWQAGRYIGTTPGGYVNDSDPEKWINGIGILVEAKPIPKMKITPHSSRPVTEMG